MVVAIPPRTALTIGDNRSHDPPYARPQRSVRRNTARTSRPFGTRPRKEPSASPHASPAAPSTTTQVPHSRPARSCFMTAITFITIILSSTKHSRARGALLKSGFDDVRAPTTHGHWSSIDPAPPSDRSWQAASFLSTSHQLFASISEAGANSIVRPAQRLSTSASLALVRTLRDRGSSRRRDALQQSGPTGSRKPSGCWWLAATTHCAARSMPWPKKYQCCRCSGNHSVGLDADPMSRCGSTSTRSNASHLSVVRYPSPAAAGAVGHPEEPRCVVPILLELLRPAIICTADQRNHNGLRLARCRALRGHHDHPHRGSVFQVRPGPRINHAASARPVSVNHLP